MESAHEGVSHSELLLREGARGRAAGRERAELRTVRVLLAAEPGAESRAGAWRARPSAAKV